MPASARRRVVRVLVDAGLIIALCAVTERCCGILFAVGAVVLLLAVMTAMMAMTGATPGGLVTGVRLRRVAETNSPPGRSAVIYVAFLGLSLVATAGLAPLVLWILSLWRAEQRTWFDRLAGTVLLSARPTSVSTCSLVVEGSVIPVLGPIVLGRRPAPIESHPDAQLVAVLRSEDSVSKTHALFVPASDGVLVTDLGSTNGTHVEDEEGVHRLSPGRPEYVHRGRQAYLGDGVCIVR